MTFANYVFVMRLFKKDMIHLPGDSIKIIIS